MESIYRNIVARVQLLKEYAPEELPLVENLLMCDKIGLALPLRITPAFGVPVMRAGRPREAAGHEWSEDTLPGDVPAPAGNDGDG